MTAIGVGNRRLERLTGVVVWLLAIGYLLPRAFRGWIPHDEGLLGQLGERALRGDLPHSDFVDPYTGGLSFLYAAAFDLLGVGTQPIRWVLLAAVALVSPFVFGLSRRFVTWWLAALVTLTALAWSVPIYFAGLPSWYGLFLAIVALWALVRHGETSQRRWLLLAGLCAGVSCTIKITGVYLIAGSVLALVDYEHRLARFLVGKALVGVPRKMDARRGFVVLAGLGAAAFVGCLLVLVRPALGGSGGSGSPLSLIIHFVFPGAALAGYLVFREARAGLKTPTGDRLRRLCTLVLWYGSGIAVPIGLFVGWFALRGGSIALEDLYIGVFVLPQKRLAFATFPLPPWWSVLLALPIGALAAWPRRLSRAAEAAVGGVLVAGLAIGLGLAGQDAAYRNFWLPLRALVPAIMAAGVFVLVRNDRDRAVGSTGSVAIGSVATGSGAGSGAKVFATLAVAAMASLIQFPDAYGIYFLYVAPLVVLAIAAVTSVNSHALRGPLFVVLLVAGIFSVGWLHRGHPLTVGLRWQPVVWDFDLVMPRGGLEVDRRSGAEAHLVAQTVLAHAQPGDVVFAAPDCPEVAFLTGTRDPLRSAFGFFNTQLDDPAALESLLEGEGVEVAVVNTRPGFSASLSKPVLQMLSRRYPNRETVGGFVVLW